MDEKSKEYETQVLQNAVKDLPPLLTGDEAREAWGVLDFSGLWFDMLNRLLHAGADGLEADAKETFEQVEGFYEEELLNHPGKGQIGHMRCHPATFISSLPILLRVEKDLNGTLGRKLIRIASAPSMPKGITKAAAYRDALWCDTVTEFFISISEALAEQAIDYRLTDQDISEFVIRARAKFEASLLDQESNFKTLFDDPENTPQERLVFVFYTILCWGSGELPASEVKSILTDLGKVLNEADARLSPEERAKQKDKVVIKAIDAKTGTMSDAKDLSDLKKEMVDKIEDCSLCPMLEHCPDAHIPAPPIFSQN